VPKPVPRYDHQLVPAELRDQVIEPAERRPHASPVIRGKQVLEAGAGDDPDGHNSASTSVRAVYDTDHNPGGDLLGQQAAVAVGQQSAPNHLPAAGPVADQVERNRRRAHHEIHDGFAAVRFDDVYVLAFFDSQAGVRGAGQEHVVRTVEKCDVASSSGRSAASASSE
jgi:hypothetical protein